jgi:hypothetical protein
MTVRPKAYVGAKIILAAPEDKDGQPGYRVVYPDGYVSWSPKATFEECYRPVNLSEQAIIESPDLRFAVETSRVNR